MNRIYAVKQAGAIKEQGVYPDCFPGREKRRELRAAGCKIYIDGKLFTEGKEHEKEARGR